MSKQKKWSLLAGLIGILLFIAFGEYKSWKEQQAFFQMEVTEGVTAELKDINEFIQSEHYRFELPREISEIEALSVNETAIEEAPADEKMAVPEAMLKEVPGFERVLSEGVFYRIDETFTMSREELLHDWVSLYYSNPENENVLKKE